MFAYPPQVIQRIIRIEDQIIAEPAQIKRGFFLLVPNVFNTRRYSFTSRSTRTRTIISHAHII